MQKQRPAFDQLRQRRSTDTAAPRKRKKRHTMPLFDKLPDASSEALKKGPDRRKRFTNPFRRQNAVLRNLISLVSRKGPTSLLSAYRYYFESSFADPLHLTTFTRMNGKLRGHIRIENKGGRSVMSLHQEDISINEDRLVQCALANDSIYLMKGNKIYMIERPGTDYIIRKERMPFATELSRMVIPLEDMGGVIDITGEDLSFGLLRPVSTSLRIAQSFSNLVSMKMASEIDALTGLLNRRAFDDAIEHCIGSYIEEGKNHSLLMLDLDRFKDVNDQYGHQNGDKVLSACALTAMSCFRASDLLSGGKTRQEQAGEMRKEMVTRYGGEEFAVLLPETDPADAIIAARRCKEAIESAVIDGINGERIRVTVSMGIASFADAERMISKEHGVVVFPPEQRGEMIRETVKDLADKALYCAKGRGRNRVATTSFNERGNVEYYIY
jgi:GGDEF domain-containing protein